MAFTLAEIKAEIDFINSQIDAEIPDDNDENTQTKETAYKQLVRAFPSISAANLAEVLSITPAQALAQYYNQDLSELPPVLSIAGDDGFVDLTDTFTASTGGQSVFGGGISSVRAPMLRTLEDIQVDTASPLASAEDLQTSLAALVPDATRRITGFTQDTPAFTTQSTLPPTLFDAINFPAPPITRGVPVVTRGLDAAGQPTTAITMGQATATPSGPDIGQLDITTQFPSTGMGINPDGTGTTTVGTPGTTGTIVASGADTIDVFGDGADASPISQNVIGTQGNQVATNLLGTTSPTATSTRSRLPTSPPQQTEAQIRAAEIQRLFKTSPTKDIAAQRIGDYAMSKGGITAEEIAAAVNPVLTGDIAAPTTFGITPDLDAPEILEAVEDFRYGTGPAGGEFITAGAVTAPTPTFPTLSQQQQRIRDLNQQAAAVGEGPYTEQEAAFRILDFARNNNLSLADAAASFGMDEAAARQAADRLGINLGNFGFAKGGEVNDARTNAVSSRLMAHSGLGSMKDKMMSPGLSDTINRIMDRKD